MSRFVEENSNIVDTEVSLSHRLITGESKYLVLTETILTSPGVTVIG